MSRIPVAVRAYTERQGAGGGGGGVPQDRWPRGVLVFDTETTTDHRQRLLFGSWLYARWTGSGTLRTVARGLFHADDLEAWKPESYATLCRYKQAHRQELGSDLAPSLGLLSRRAFLHEVFYPAACEAQMLVCGFNLPFDLTRLAFHAGRAQRGSFRGGFSLPLFEYYDERRGRWREDKYKPRLAFKTLDSKRAFIGFNKPRDSEFYRPGRFLDLRSLAYALTHQSHSLASACEAFGVEEAKGEAEHEGEVSPAYIDYCRQDVRATAGLLEQLRAEFDRHPIDLDPDKTFSPASIAKAYLRALGLTPPAEKFDVSPKWLGRAMVSYFGGRAECRIPRTEVPVVYLDVLSMYPTVNSLMNHWKLLAAETLQLQDVTGPVETMLDEIEADDLFEPDVWPRLTVLARVRPEDDILPVRGEYEPETRNLNIGVNRFTSDQDCWYALPDLLASTLLTGEPPEIREAIRLLPEGTEDGLEPVALGGELKVDPRKEDFFQAVIERRKGMGEDRPQAERDRLDRFLKTLANSGSYGSFAEIIRKRVAKSEPETVQVHGRTGSYPVETDRPEEPGEFCFPPLAALTTAGARLMLALIEHEVAARGGTYAFGDTDSMAVVATEDGGLVPCPGGDEQMPDGWEAVRALSWEEVEAVVEKFEALKPYDPDTVSDPVLEVEDVNFGPDGQQRAIWAFAVSAKRYVLYRQDGDNLEVVDAKEHGLGHLLDPVAPGSESVDWIEEIWRCAVREARGEEVDLPEWMDRPAVSRLTVSSYGLYEPFEDLNRGRPYPEQVKPMNFMLAVSTKPCGEPAGVDPTAFRLVAPYDPDRETWSSMRWINRFTGRTYPVTTTGSSGAHQAEIRSYRDVYRDYIRHPEPKSAGPEGGSCDRQTVGLLRRRHDRPLGAIQKIGKETNRLEDVQQGLVGDRNEVLADYSGEDVPRSVLDSLPVAKLASMAVSASGRSTGWRPGTSSRRQTRGDGCGSLSSRPYRARWNENRLRTRNISFFKGHFTLSINTTTSDICDLN